MPVICAQQLGVGWGRLVGREGHAVKVAVGAQLVEVIPEHMVEGRVEGQEASAQALVSHEKMPSLSPGAAGPASWFRMLWSSLSAS